MSSSVIERDILDINFHLFAYYYATTSYQKQTACVVDISKTTIRHNFQCCITYYARGEKIARLRRKLCYHGPNRRRKVFVTIKYSHLCNYSARAA